MNKKDVEKFFEDIKPSGNPVHDLMEDFLKQKIHCKNTPSLGSIFNSQNVSSKQRTELAIKKWLHILEQEQRYQACQRKLKDLGLK